jgi:hypothetical protein
MAEQFKKFVMTDGKASWRKILLVFMVPVTMFVLSTAYARYSWMRDQSYKVAINEKYIIEAKRNLERKDKELQKAIDALKVEIDKKSGILHSRANKETDKREKGDERLLDLILKSIKQQQDLMEQRAK